MWAALAVSAVMTAAPADAGALQIKNDRFTYGVYGQVRTDTQVLPGEIVFVAFDVDGLQTLDDGTASYTTALELLDKGGKSLFKETPVERKALLPMGGNHLPNWSQVIVGSDTRAGNLHHPRHRRGQARQERPAGRPRKEVRADGAALRPDPHGPVLR